MARRLNRQRVSAQRMVGRTLLRWGAGLIGGASLLAGMGAVQAQTAPEAPSAPLAPATARPVLQIGSEGEAVRQVQALLLLLGFYNGAVDGLYGASTAIAVADFQDAVGLMPDGIVGAASWDKLLPSLAMVAENVAPESDSTSAESSSDSVAGNTEAGNAEAIASPDTPATSAPPADPAIAPDAAPEPNPTSSPEPSPDRATSEDTEAAAAVDPVDLPILRLGMQGPAVERLQERLQALGFYNGAIDGIFGEATRSAVETAQRNYAIPPDGVVGPVTWAALLR